MAVKKLTADLRDYIEERVADHKASASNIQEIDESDQENEISYAVGSSDISAVVEDDGWCYKIDEEGNLLERWVNPLADNLKYNYKTKEEAIVAVEGMKQKCEEAIQEVIQRVIEEATQRANVLREMEVARRERETAQIVEAVRTLQAVLDDTILWERSLAEPVIVDKGVLKDVLLHASWNGVGHPYLFQNCVYVVTGNYTVDQEILLVQESFDAERRRFERLKHRFTGGDSANTQSSRIPIPEDVRIAVWRRDGGSCARCGSRERLEYDHIIPVSRGGSNTVRNIELLCEACNRSKSDHIQ